MVWDRLWETNLCNSGTIGDIANLICCYAVKRVLYIVQVAILEGDLITSSTTLKVTTIVPLIFTCINNNAINHGSVMVKKPCFVLYFKS